ncbi:putative CtpA-like serine protease [bacterium HR35]|nr:putative CtpA-like serine protease [bacterium HR35]
MPPILVFSFLSFRFLNPLFLLANQETTPFSQEEMRIFYRTWEVVNNYFVEPEKIDKQKAILEASRGLLRSLDDPYSEIFDEKQAKIFEEDMSGSFAGVGMEIGIRKGVLTVISPLEGTPAERAGIKSGDKILKIDGEDTSNLTLEEAVSKIRGKPGTKVTLTIYRDEWLEPKDFTLVRETINIPAVKSKLLLRNIGYIKLNTFNLTTYSEFIKAYLNLKDKGAKYWILDLRNNPGGFLEVAIQLAESFLPRGQIILKEQKRDKSTTNIVSEGPGNLSNLRIVVLVNDGSASASEILAGALRDNLGIKLIGKKTYGKGSVQQIFPLDGKMIKLTVAYWLTPKGIKLEGSGLKPDIEVEEIEKEKIKTELDDPVIRKAIQVVRSLQ